MHSRFFFVSILLLTFGATFAWALSQPHTPLAQAPSAERKTVWTGVYTEAQAVRGAQEYVTYCSPCHGIDLDGVARLKGPDFMERWREFDVRSLYEFISKSMPRERRGSPNKPGSLSEATYVSILAHIFRSNSFPAGSEELSTALMKTIHIEEKDGPKPVPNGALVQTVGCMVRRGTQWLLTDASEPTRTSTSRASTEEELEKRQDDGSGTIKVSVIQFGLSRRRF